MNHCEIVVNGDCNHDGWECRTHFPCRNHRTGLRIQEESPCGADRRIAIVKPFLPRKGLFQ